jgi:hypothetical protein
MAVDIYSDEGSDEYMLTRPLQALVRRRARAGASRGADGAGARAAAGHLHVGAQRRLEQPESEPARHRDQRRVRRPCPPAPAAAS